MINIVTIVGARPQFIKAAVLSRLIRDGYSGSIKESIVHTGQHYDENMSEVFFRSMDIPEPVVNLEVGSGTHGYTTGTMLMRIEEQLLQRKPDYVVVYGDTNSTLAGALAAGKINIPVIHVEAGLRSFFKRMPEEHNRIVADHLSSILFCPTDTAASNLAHEGIATSGSSGFPLVVKSGDVMYDAALFYGKKIDADGTGDLLNKDVVDLTDQLAGGFYLLTLHRAENTDDVNRLKSIVDTLNAYNDIDFVFPLHPRTKKALHEAGIQLKPHIHVIEPVGYIDMLFLESKCRLIVTDSGGIQKEAYFHKKPCITLRDQTEWTETINTGWNTLVGANPIKIRGAFETAKAPAQHPDIFGDGNAGAQIVDTLLNLNTK